MGNQALIAATVGSCLVAGGLLAAALRAWRQAERSADPEEAPSEDLPTRLRRRAGASGRSWGVIGAWLRPGERQMADLEVRLTHAGIRGTDAVDLFLTVRLMVMVGGLALVLLGVFSGGSSLPRMLLLLAVAAVSLVGPQRWVDWRIRRRQAEVSADLPSMLDLLIVCLEAGLGLEQALDRVVGADEGRGDEAGLLEGSILDREMQSVIADIRVGVSVEAAFRRFAARVGSDDASNVAMAIAKAAGMGAKMGDLLRGHSKSMRQRQLLRLEEMTGKANAKLSLPLTLCLLPAALLLMMGPTVLALFENL